MSKQPSEIRRLGPSGVFIRWRDGRESTIDSASLRRACPCASCREMRGEHRHDKPLSAPPKKTLLQVVQSSPEEEVRLDNIWAVGQYALGARWGDGHASGIYTFETLFELAEKAEHGR